MTIDLIVCTVLIRRSYASHECVCACVCVEYMKGLIQWDLMNIVSQFKICDEDYA